MPLPSVSARYRAGIIQQKALEDLSVECVTEGPDESDGMYSFCKAPRGSYQSSKINPLLESTENWEVQAAKTIATIGGDLAFSIDSSIRADLDMHMLMGPTCGL